jgi:dGTPase
VRYGAELLVPEQTRVEIGALKGIAARYVMFTADREAALEAERDLVAELAGLVLLGAPGTLEPSLRADWADAADDAGRRRVVVDQVASLTDPSARDLHARLRAEPWAR